MSLETLEQEISLLIEQAKTNLGDVYDMGILEEVSLSDFSRLSKSAESLVLAVRDIMFINNRKYLRTEELNTYKEFFIENKLDANIRVMTYPSIMKSIQFKLNSPALMTYIKESIVRYSERGEEIDIEDIRQRSMSYMFKSLTGKALRSETMRRSQFADELEKIIKDEGKTFVKVHPHKIIRLATMLPSVISYIDTDLLTHQIKTFSLFAKDYSKKMEQIAANYPDDFNLSKEITKYKQLLENAVYDMVFIYRTIRNLLIDLNDEYYRVLRFLKTTYGRSSAMNEHAKILDIVDSLIESVDYLDMQKAQHDVGLLTEGAITDALRNFRDKLSTSIKNMGEEMDRVKKRNVAFRSRQKQFKNLMNKIKKNKLVPTESMTLYQGTFDNMRVRFPNEFMISYDSGRLTGIERLAKNPLDQRRYANKEFADTPAMIEYNAEIANKIKHQILLTYCDYTAFKSEKMNIELAVKILRNFYLGERVTAMPDMKKMYSNLVRYSNVFRLLDTISYYKIYEQFKHVTSVLDEAAASGQFTSKELSSMLAYYKDEVTFELRVIEEHHDCIIKLADETYNVLKRVAEDNDSEVVFPKLLKESYQGMMIESVDGEDFIPVAEITESDIAAAVDPSEVPVGVTLVSDDGTEVQGEQEVSPEEIAEIPDQETIELGDDCETPECTQAINMIESVLLMAANGAVIEPSILVESAESLDLTEYTPIFESVQLILEATEANSTPGFIAKIKEAVSKILKTLKETKTWQKLKAIGTAVKGMFKNIRSKIQAAEDAGKKEDATKLKMVLGKLASVVSGIEHVGKTIGTDPKAVQTLTNELLFEMEWRKSMKNGPQD